jgi:glycosyltransferase involved in cell wall biosynthesis
LLDKHRVRVYEKIERWAMRWADQVVAVSKGYSDYLVKSGLQRKNIKVVQNAIDTARMNVSVTQRNAKREEMGFSEDDFLIATSGRLSPEKAHVNLIKAFDRIKSLFPKTQLLIIGDGMLFDELKIIAASQATSSINFLGFRRDMDQIMSAIDLFVLPSLTEGLPNVVLEAFAARKTVVATSVGGVPEIVEDGVNGFLCEPGDIESLADAIIKALSQQELLAKMGFSGFNKVQQKFSVEIQEKSLECVYNLVIKGKLTHE